MSSIPINIKSMDLKFSWSYPATDSSDGKCTLCKKDIMSVTFEDINKGQLRSRIVSGTCGHSYHQQCMDNFIKTNDSVCPIDGTPWNGRVLDDVSKITTSNIAFPVNNKSGLAKIIPTKSASHIVSNYITNSTKKGLPVKLKSPL